MEQKHIRMKGFTLIELSIVVVIIGLTVAGVVAGQSLALQAKNRNIISDLNKYSTAINVFKLQYNGLPGDLPDAQNYWGAGTANGNGNNIVTWSVEALDLWQHLSLSGTIPEQYSGLAVYAPGSTFPNAPYTGSGYYAHSGELNIGTGFLDSSKLLLFFGGYTTVNYGAGYNPIATSVSIAQIDTKMDDGLPHSGRQRIRAYEAPTCSQGAYSFPNNTAQIAANAYNIQTPGNICNMIFVIN